MKVRPEVVETSFGEQEQCSELDLLERAGRR